MSSKPALVCLHGYGMRSGFWDVFRESEKDRYEEILCPDLVIDDIPEGVARVKDILGRLASAPTTEKKPPTLVLGHSLGGVLASLALKELLEDEGWFPETMGLIVLSSPYGGTRRSLPPLLRSLYRLRLIPPPLLRRKFFGRGIPGKLQKELFGKAVKESDSLKARILARPWYHVGRFPESFGRAIPALVLASGADKIVPWHESAAFAEALGAEFFCFPPDFRLGHDDIAVSRRVARLVGDRVAGFASRLRAASCPT